MSTTCGTRPGPREAGPELLALQKWEEVAGWLIERTAKWPKSARFSLVQKVDNHALDIVEMLVVARYEPRERRVVLGEINLRLERLRFLLRIARTHNVMPAASFGGEPCQKQLRHPRERVEAVPGTVPGRHRTGD